MATKRNVGSDRARISAQKHEVAYAGKKLGKDAGGAEAIKSAKSALGRKTSRKAVMEKAGKKRKVS